MTATSLEMSPTSLEQLTKVQALLIHLEANGIAKASIRNKRKILVNMAKTIDLNDTAAAKLYIARRMKKNKLPVTNCYKRKMVEAYSNYCKYNKIPFERPIYHGEEHSIQPPSEERVSNLIAASRSPLSLKIDIMQQTGLRPIEITGAKGLCANDIHTDQSTITAISTKRCHARPALKITPELNAKLSEYIRANKITGQQKLFLGEPERFGNEFRNLKNRLAMRLKDPSYKSIRLYDLRHYYITKQLRKTQNCEIVRQIVGHKSLNTTQKYMHLLISTIGEYITEQTNDRNRAEQLLKTDYTYILTTPDGYMLFRKPK